MSSSGLVSYNCEGGSHGAPELITCGGGIVSGGRLWVGEIPRRVNSNKEEGCDHELSVWPLRLGGGSMTNQKSRSVRGQVVNLVMKPLSLRCL